MKKILYLVLCIFFVFSLTACGNNSGGNGHSVDVEYYAKLGQINDVDYRLGDDVDETKSVISTATVSDEGEYLYYDYQSGDYTIMTDGTVCCCYKTDDKAAGITYIVKYGDAYGFNVGTVSTQVRDSMSNMGYETEEREAKNGELFFLPASTGITVLEYQIKENTVLFVFQEHALSTAVIYKK